jgi:RNA polymerase sigma factor (sigma-70 family)
LVRDHLDAQRRSVKRQQSLPEDSWRHPQAPDNSPSQEAVAAEQRQTLCSALEQLRSEDRDIIRLRVTDGRSTRDVAAELGITPVAVAKRLERALRRLRVTAAGPTTHTSGEGHDHD